MATGSRAPPPPHVDSAASAVSQAITARPTYVFAGPSRVGKGTDQGPQPASFSPLSLSTRAARVPVNAADATPTRVDLHPLAALIVTVSSSWPDAISCQWRCKAPNRVASVRSELSRPRPPAKQTRSHSLVSCVSGVPSRANDNDPGPPVDRRSARVVPRA